ANRERRAVDAVDQGQAAAADVIPGVYTTGWIKRGPVGLIGHTKGDALETIGHILDDQAAGALTEPLYPEESSIIELLESKGVDFTDWEGYHRLDDRGLLDRKSTRLNSSHVSSSYAVFCV